MKAATMTQAFAMIKKAPRAWLIPILLLLACSCAKRASLEPPLNRETADRLYERAIADASVFRQENVHPLPRITSDWVRVVNWTNKDFSVGETTLESELWVTLAPVVRERCLQWRGALETRLEQLLGLPPENGYTHFVEMRVRAVDLWRPCPNPDIRSDQCGNQFPDRTDPEYLAWYAQTLLSSYRIPEGYPFTGLGYTYDWHPETTRFGPAELVVRKGSRVEVLAVSDTQEYCRSQR